jgi:GNAT superfamily N-acetyltransferase
MARLRAEQWGDSDYWAARISRYLDGELHPQQALPDRIAFVAVKDDRVVGLIAGHLTRRFGCEGELEWINAASDQRRSGISSQLLLLLAQWFVSHDARYICVNCASDNLIAQNFYKKHGAEDLKPHWLVWKDISSVY